MRVAEVEGEGGRGSSDNASAAHHQTMDAAAAAAVGVVHVRVEEEAVDNDDIDLPLPHRLLYWYSTIPRYAPFEPNGSSNVIKYYYYYCTYPCNCALMYSNNCVLSLVLVVDTRNTEAL